MFKKIIALVMCLMFALTAVACGDNDSADDTNGDTASTASENKPMFEGDTNQQITGYIAHAKLVENEPKDNGRTCEIISRDNALVYVYRYVMSFSDPVATFGSINNGLDNKKATYDKLYDEMKALVPTVEAVIIELYTKEGELALSKKYVSGSDVVTGGAYAPVSAGTSSKGLYGTWVTVVDVANLVTAEYPDALVEQKTLTVDYIMTFSEDGKCVAETKIDRDFYEVLLKTVEDYLKTTTTNADAVKTELDNYKAKYTQDLINAQFNTRDEGIFTLTGDANTTGTFELDGENMEGRMKFVINGNSLDLIPLDGEGNEFADSKLSFTRK